MLIYIASGALAGLLIGLWLGHYRWGPKWYDTSEGIDRRFRKMGPF